jgi:hypothetical protein
MTAPPGDGPLCEFYLIKPAVESAADGASQKLDRLLQSPSIQQPRSILGNGRHGTLPRVRGVHRDVWSPLLTSARFGAGVAFYWLKTTTE